MRDIVALSVVSHRQGALVLDLLRDMRRNVRSNVSIFLTVNIAETLPFRPSDFSFPIFIHENAVIKGFSENHNAAYRRCTETLKSRHFCILNPDIRLRSDPFPSLISHMNGMDGEVAAAAPLIKNIIGGVEDSARHLPTPWRILKKAAFKQPDVTPPHTTELFFPDWIAGMFMLFRSDIFGKVGGFDERYFLYYEDVDLCCRLRLAGYKVILDPSVSVIHDARRESHRNVRYMKWHVASMARFFTSPVFFRSLWRKWRNKEASGSV